MKIFKRNVIYNLLLAIFLLIPIFFVFKSLFLSGSLALGDAPNFYKEGLKELFSEPSVWTERGQAFGGVNALLWLSPIMFLFGIFYRLFGLNSDVILRILFYFPSLFFSVLGISFLGKYLKLSKVGRFFAVLIYLFNTYFLMVVDGGQIGIALAYGLFPLTILFLKKLTDFVSFKSFYLALFFSFILTLADPRIFAISFLVLFLWNLIEICFCKKSAKGLLFLSLMALLILPLNSFWLFPLIKIGSPAISLEISSLNFSSLLNSLTLFSPHWPDNVFGHITQPYFYFLGIPVLISLSLFLKRKKIPHFVLLFLIFAFLAKGSTPPLGWIYDWVIVNVPFASSFRDSSKFFIPLILFAAILIGNLVDGLMEKFKQKKKLAFLIPVIIYLYCLFLVSPSFLGKLNFVLSENKHSQSLQQVYKLLNSDESFFRSLWFPERHPLAFEVKEKPALDAKRLIDFRPFGSLNVGTYNYFNFFHQGNWQDWFKLLGIKYLVFSGDQRNPFLEENRKEEFVDLVDFVRKEGDLKELDLSTDISVFEVNDTKPRIFAVEKLFIVVGSDDVYEKVEGRLSTFSRANQGFVFIEDGKSDSEVFTDPDSEFNATSIMWILNGKTKDDVKMSFLKKYFINVNKSVSSDWKIFKPSDYLDWKFQLLSRGITAKEFDYGMGIFLSSQEKEKIAFKIDVPENGDYFLALRVMQGDDSKGLNYSFAGKQEYLKNDSRGNFNWNIVGPLTLKKGKENAVLENLGGLSVLNLVALIPKNDFDLAQIQTENLFSTYKFLDLDKVGDFEQLLNILGKQKIEQIGFERYGSVGYTLETPINSDWIIFTDSFHPMWKLQKGTDYYDSLPFYSMVNGFYVEDSWTNLFLVFRGQEIFRWGIYFSLISILTVVIVFLLFVERKNEREN